MTKELLLRIYEGKGVRALYSDRLEIEEFERIMGWCQNRISDIRAMYPKEELKKE